MITHTKFMVGVSSWFSGEDSALTAEGLRSVPSPVTKIAQATQPKINKAKTKNWKKVMVDTLTMTCFPHLTGLLTFLLIKIDDVFLKVQVLMPFPSPVAKVNATLYIL